MPLRVAAYCRVSTDRADQANSLASQETYFLSHIHSHPGWALAGIYADEGISGTSTRRREAFRRMLDDARGGRIDLILTKEVSRFARNTVDVLEYTRLLKTLGIGVLFLNDNIDTRDNDGELRLTLMAGMAQEESRKTSERVKWGQRRRMEAGVVFGSNTLYGYDLAGGQLTVKPEEARVVRRIYQKLLEEGKGTHVIARELWEEGVSPPRSPSGRWSPAMVRRILRNEKYAGDLLQGKSVTVDHLTHKRVPNREGRILLKDHHAPIVPRETWEAAQAELDRRAALRGEGSKYSGRSWCSGKLRCGACGSPLLPRQAHRRDGTLYRSWCCRARREGAPCPTPSLNDAALTFCLSFLLQQLGLDPLSILDDLTAQLSLLPAPGEDRSLRARRQALEAKRLGAADAFLAGLISLSELTALREKYDRELDQLRRQAAPARPLPVDLSPLRADPLSAPEVLRALIRRVTLFPDRLEVEVEHIPGRFRLWPSATGRGRTYAVTVDRWDHLPPP